MRKEAGRTIYSPSDLIGYLASPFASWLDRCYLEDPSAVVPDEKSEDQKLLAQTGDQHEASVLAEFSDSTPELVTIPKDDPIAARERTLSAIEAKAPIIFQAALEDGAFAGFADFLILDSSGLYQVWDAKLARNPKPYYAIQLCCYSEMFSAMTGHSMPEQIGIILGNNERAAFRVEDFIHYYRHIKHNFLDMHARFSGRPEDAPEPLPRADHGRWSSRANQYFTDTDHLVQVANISVGQIKKLRADDIATMAGLSAASGKGIPKLDPGTLEKLVAQARLQCQTRDDRKANADSKPSYDVLPHKGPNGERLGLAVLPPSDAADVFFDMEGYPLVPGGLEYLFGTWTRNPHTSEFEFREWWAHDRDEEKVAFENFVDWVFDRWRKNPGMHIYHYANYEVSAVRRLSTRHDTRQEEVDELLRHNVFVDLYKIVRHGLRIGEDSYSLKAIELLYRPKRATGVASASDSMVQYANWMQSGQSRGWKSSSILKGLRDYNEDDCKSTAELTDWLRKVATQQGISFSAGISESGKPAPKPAAPEIGARQELAAKLRGQGNPLSLVLADVVDFHRRELKPMWWRMFERADATAEELRDDSGCIEGMKSVGAYVAEKKSFLQKYTFDPSQECKLDADDRVMFTHNLDASFAIATIDLDSGEVTLKIGKRGLAEKCKGVFPTGGSILKNEYVNPGEIPGALADIGHEQLSNSLHASVKSLLVHSAPATQLQKDGEAPLDAALRIGGSMSGGCLVIQGPPGTGKTYTASCVIEALLAGGKKVGAASNSHKAVVNLLAACGEAARRNGHKLVGIKVGDEPDGPLHSANPGLNHIKDTSAARAAYSDGIVGGTAWLFSRPEWNNALDFLFIDEAGQVPLANAVAMARSANNLVLLGDQMQLEQPVQGAHPGDAGLSALQYALKDTTTSKPDAPIFHAVVPANLGLFLGESRRMHPDVCRFISESIYESRLGSIPECANQKIALTPGGGALVTVESGIVFSGIEHDGDIQQSDEEVQRVKAIYNELFNRPFSDKDGKTKPLELNNFLFIAPYNAQVRALKAALPKRARVGSVDKFQGQEAAVCILSLCSSYGEYGSRGLKFILDRSRINVAISRAKCLAIVVGDPRIASTAAGSIGDMKLLNLYCKLVNAISR
jgi:predicted RecB family nuclease